MPCWGRRGGKEGFGVRGDVLLWASNRCSADHPRQGSLCLIGEIKSMRINSERREQIADAALEVLAAEGAHGLTHRAVDECAGLPRGTTSNFFNSRQELFLVAGQRLVNRHWAYVHLLSEEMGSPLDRRKLAVILSKVLSGEGEIRLLHLAKYELFLAGVRDPSLHSVLIELRHAALEMAVTLLQSARLPEADRRVQFLSSILNGLLFDQLTVPNKDVALIHPEMVEEIIDALFGLPPEETEE